MSGDGVMCDPQEEKGVERLQGMGLKAKTLHNCDSDEVGENVPDIKVYGNPDCFRLICKASSEGEGWMKSTKAFSLSAGCLVQVTTQQRNPDGSYALAEALTFVPGVTIDDLIFSS